MHIVVAPDSFKGTMSSTQVCEIIERSIKKSLPNAKVSKIPVADGGEGTVDAFLEFAGGKRIREVVTSPDFSKVEAFYAVLEDGKTAVIEMAAASGLPLVQGRKNPMQLTTIGTGELIVSAARHGCTKVILGMGGSATMDGGAGMAAAMGVAFRNKDGVESTPTAEGIKEIEEVDLSAVLPQVSAIEFLLASDVKNELCGRGGAAYVFGPQKGATANDVKRADENLAHFAKILGQKSGKELKTIPGTGAAGGLALPLLAFFNTTIVPGIDLVLDTAKFDEVLKDADLVVTGEGRIDGQSMEGKVPVGVARKAHAKGVPVIALAGILGEGYEKTYEQGIAAIFTSSKSEIPFEIAQKTAKEDLALLADSVFALFQIGAKQ